MNEHYNPQTLEPTWQTRWEERQAYEVSDDASSTGYVLEMFPYPSGAMHMGHVRNYLIGDVIARYMRLQGTEVLHPMGWDALGLPAENAAIKDKQHPEKRTAENIKSFKNEMKRLGFSYQWSREISTADPSYYKWNQWFFLKMRERNLVYRRKASVNWCNDCHTVIANEQVVDGCCERCNGTVIIRQMPEWAIRITNYAERLLENLDQLIHWPTEVIKKQRNWIGKNEGVFFDFKVMNTDVTLRVFTTRPDTIFGCSYLGISADHPDIAAIVTEKHKQQTDRFIKDQTTQKTTRQHDRSDIPKEGVNTGAIAIHPMTGEKLPVWLANFVVSDYGTGAVMSVPAHDQRDMDFAQTYDLPIKAVIKPSDNQDTDIHNGVAFIDEGILVDSDSFTGLTSKQATAAIAQHVQKQNIGEPAVTFRQRDWGISRQRYWGTPIPIVYCDQCDPNHEGIAVPYEDLPVKLPDIDVEQVLTGRGEPPLAKVSSFLNTTCPLCKGPATREAETMDTFVDSAWYFARYLDPHNNDLPFTSDKANQWFPIDVYIGGPEHSTMHLLYCRFWMMVMNEMGLTTHQEPIKTLITQGIVNGPDGRKMSKRWGNVVSPSDIIKDYGTDAVRTFVMFAGPMDKDIKWSNEQVEGCHRFLHRLWRLAYNHRDSVSILSKQSVDHDLEIQRETHKTLKRVTTDFERHSFNTIIARCMELVNFLTARKLTHTDQEKNSIVEAIQLLAAMLFPIAPHITSEIATTYCSEHLLDLGKFPTYIQELTVDKHVNYTIQINGKRRGQVTAASDATEEDIKTLINDMSQITRYLEGTIIKTIFVPKKLINFVVKP